MVGAADVVTWDKGDKRSSSVGAGGLQAAQGVGGNGRFAAVTVSSGLDTSVHTLISVSGFDTTLKE
jgi:hypothetical protein